MVRDRVARYEAEAGRRAYLAGLSRTNEEMAARLRSGDSAVPPAPQAPVGNSVPTVGDKADVTMDFSSYSPVGHYVPDVVEEESQRG